MIIICRFPAVISVDSKHIKLRTFALSDHYMTYKLLRVRAVINLQCDRQTESYVMSSATRFVEEYCQPGDLKPEKSQRKPKMDKNLYEVEVVEVDTARLRLKIRFVGFSEEYDECRDFCNERNYFPFVRLEQMFYADEGSLEDRNKIFYGQRYRFIKTDDPEVLVEFTVEPDVFGIELGQV